MKCFKVCLVLVALMSGMAQAALTHQYTFNDFTADDSANDCDGGLVGTGIGWHTVGLQRSVTLDGMDAYVDLGGPCIAINTYSELTLELWSTQGLDDQSYSMTAALGGTQDWFGKRYVVISTTRGDQVSRAMMTGDNDNPGYETEVGVNWYELNDELEHHYVLTVGPCPCCDAEGVYLSFYVDGNLIGTLNIMDRSISSMSNDFAYLGKSLYPGDPLFYGYINEFNIYNTALSCAEVQASYARGPVPIPEPATMVLLGLGSLALVRRRRA